jgi:hypothetical protein
VILTRSPAARLRYLYLLKNNYRNKKTVEDYQITFDVSKTRTQQYGDGSVVSQMATLGKEKVGKLCKIGWVPISYSEAV